MKSKILKYTLSFAAAAVLVWFSFRKVDWNAFLEGLKMTRWSYMLLYLVAAVGALVFRCFRWHSILTPLDGNIRSMRVWDANNIGNIINVVLPAAGEFTRCGLVSTKKARYDKVFGTIACERACDFIAIAVIFLATFAIDWNTFSTFFRDNIWTPLASELGPGLWLITAGLAVLAGGFIFAVFHWRERNGFCGKIAGVFTGLADGFTSFAKMERKWLFATYTVLIWLMYFLMSYFVMLAIPATAVLPLAAALFITAVGNIASVIPVPGGIGAYHYLVALTIQAIYVLPWETGILYATLNHESHAVLVIVLGLISYIFFNFRKKRAEA